MADDGEPQYKLVDLATLVEGNSSRDFTGKGRATYANGDIYEGDFLNGVGDRSECSGQNRSRNLHLQERRSQIRGQMER